MLVVRSIMHRHWMLTALEAGTAPLNDDEVARFAEEQTRQTINQMCFQLEAESVLTRVDGAPSGARVDVDGVDEWLMVLAECRASGLGESRAEAQVGR